MLSKRSLVVVHCWRHATAIFHAIDDVGCWKFLSPKPHDDATTSSAGEYNFDHTPCTPMQDWCI
eukprot:scaffold25689_cov94-Skeletonema_dohrnii-CCMP3373.AAC.1